MRTLLIVLLAWTGVSVCVLLGVMFGTGLGTRKGWEQGYRQGVADATAHPDLGLRLQQEETESLPADRRVS